MTEDLPAGQCVCGRPLPEGALSDWACGEPCQSAWLMHQANPDYPHPRQIREAAEKSVWFQGFRGTVEWQGAEDDLTRPRSGMIPNGTEINADGDPYVRVGGHWQPAGMWTPLRDGLGRAAGYRRWCPDCMSRQDSLIYPGTDRQECSACDYQWPGRPLLGWVETRGTPWPGLRMLLSDGQRSVTMTFSDEEVQAAGARMGERLERSWLGLERQLCGGYADIDQPSERQLLHAARRLRRGWHSCADLP